jgi:hypothetical protein
MKNNSFANVMDKIVAQAEAERLQEIVAAKRAETMRRVRKAATFVVLAATVVVAYNFRDELSKKVAAVLPVKTASAEAPTGKISASLQGAEQNAAVRDNLIDSMGK